jgi:hypothetical protein
MSKSVRMATGSYATLRTCLCIAHCGAIQFLRAGHTAGIMHTRRRRQARRRACWPAAARPPVRRTALPPQPTPVHIDIRRSPVCGGLPGEREWNGCARTVGDDGVKESARPPPQTRRIRDHHVRSVPQRKRCKVGPHIGPRCPTPPSFLPSATAHPSQASLSLSLTHPPTHTHTLSVHMCVWGGRCGQGIRWLLERGLPVPWTTCASISVPNV